jgi:prolyl-tRNA synthetase
VRVDDRDHVRPGAKFYEWELKGVPLRLELGVRDLDAGLVTVVRRDADGRSQVPLDGVATVVPELLEEIQRSLFEQALAFQHAHTAHIDDREQLFAHLSAGRGFAVAHWCGRESCETEVKASTSATIRLLTLEPEDPGAPCAVCGRPGTETATWAQAY